MKHKLLTASAALPLAMMLGGGAIYCLVTAFSLPVEDPKLLLTVWVLCALGGCVLFSIPKAGLPAVAASASAMFWLWSSWEIALPFRALICRISIVYDQGYGWGAVRFAGLDWESMTLDPLFACWGGAIALVAVAAVIKGRGGLVAIFLSLPPIVSTMVVTDTPPAALPLFFYLTAVFLLILTRFVARRDTLQGAKLAAMAIVPTALVLGGLLLLCPKDTYVNKAQERLDALSHWWDTSVVSLFRGSGLGEDLTPAPTASASTRLGSLGPRRVIPYEVMTLTADFDGPLYLRGQDYDKYDGMSWTATLDRNEYLPSSSYFSHRGKVTVTTNQPMAVQYIPSYQAKPKQLINGRLDNPDGLTEFEWSVSKFAGFPDMWNSNYIDRSTLDHYLELPEDTLEWAEPLVDQIIYEVLAAEVLASEGYVIDHDAVAIDRTTGTVTVKMEDYGYVESHANFVQSIVDYVANSATYSLNTGRMDDSYGDFAQWFLEESDTGYCVHFATAATVLLRAAGIPARYVTGYMVNCEAGKTVTVESDRAHAWVEYYDDVLNTWLIAEPTPPDLSEDEPEDESVTAPPPVTQPLTEPEETETAAPTEPATRPGQNGGDVEVDISIEEIRIWETLRWFVLTAAILAVIVLQRLIRIALRRRSLTGGPNRRALGLWQDVERISAFLKQEPPEELLELAQKAKFSQYELTKEELHRFTAWLKAARKELRSRPVFQRIWCRYVLALW